MKKIVILFLIGITPLLSVFGNDTYLHLDKSFYVTGEVIWYKLYLGPNFQEQSITLNAIVADQKGKVVGSEFLKSEGKPTVNGYYKIPFSADSGMYLLRFTATEASGNTVILSEVEVPIYNDLQGVAQLVKQGEDMATGTMTPNFGGQLQVAISLPKEQFNQRDLVKANIKVTNSAGQSVPASLSVAVVDKEIAGMGKIVTTAAPTSATYKDEIQIKAKVYDTNKQPLSASIIGGFSAQDERIYYSKVDNEGNFSMKLPEFTGEKRVQFLGDSKGIDNIIVKVQEEIDYQSTTPLPFNDKIRDYLTASRQRKKIFQHYGSLESELQLAKVENNIKKLKAHQKWSIKEYEYFEYMYIFFKENLSPLRFTFNADSTYSAAMYNPANQTSDKFFSGKPLFIIDNIATRDADYVARMPMEEVKTVELYYRLKDLNRKFKIFGNSGVVKITTYNPLNKLPVAESKNNLVVHGIKQQTSFPVFEPAQVNNDRRQPFFRPQLYWNSNLTTDKTGQTACSWHQTDDRSTFVIQVVVQGPNGEMGYATKEFVVE